jgi:hypothetical protein
VEYSCAFNSSRKFNPLKIGVGFGIPLLGIVSREGTQIRQGSSERLEPAASTFFSGEIATAKLASFCPIPSRRLQAKVALLSLRSTELDGRMIEQLYFLVRTRKHQPLSYIK